MSLEAVKPVPFASAVRIAKEFVTARRNGQSVGGYPGPIPPDLASAYECQEAAIDLWPDEIAGWKIGRIPPEHEKALGELRLAGPIFRRQIHFSRPGTPVEIGIFVGGFAAVEAEYIFEIGKDAPPSQTRWSLNEAAQLVGRMMVGVETAGSPLATINKLGPTVVVSDFGNNAGLILGGEVPNWRGRLMSELTCETFIEGKSVGRGGAVNIPGGPLEALKFMVEHGAKRGRPLKAGMLISTGAATGIHDITAGQAARVEFHGIGTVDCIATPRSADNR